jgi:hypothetical protein
MKIEKRHLDILGTVLFDLFLLWAIVKFSLGGWENGKRMFTWWISHGGWVQTRGWILILVLIFLALIKSNYKRDVPVFLSTFMLAYWGEWWGTTRGAWKYFGNETPPLYIIFLWGISVITVYHLYLLLRGRAKETQNKYRTRIQMFILLVLPVIGLAFTWQGLIRIELMKYVDIHPIAGIIVTLVLILKNFDWDETFWIFVCGTLLGGLYEYHGTDLGGWEYITGKGLPLLIAPLWGFACIAMIKLGILIREGCSRFVLLLRSKGSPESSFSPP